MKLFITIILLSILSQCFGCINEVSRYLKDGTLIYSDEEGRIPYGHFIEKDSLLKIGLKNLDSLYQKTDSIEFLSDKGVLLIFLKEYKAAEQIYLFIESKIPNLYSTASNLGTLYELMGDNQKALKWIKKSYKIDPKSHNNSEWIHINILEAKIKGKDYINSNNLINYSFKDSTYPISNLTKKELESLADALYFQLNERITFIKEKDEIVGLLLFELGNCEYALGEHNYGTAIEDYKLALKYGYVTEDIIERLDDSYKSYQKWFDIHMENLKNKSTPLKGLEVNPIVTFILLMLLILTTGLLIINKRKQ